MVLPRFCAIPGVELSIATQQLLSEGKGTYLLYKPDYLISIPRSHSRKTELTHKSCPLTSIHMPAVSTQTQKVQKRKLKELSAAAMAQARILKTNQLVPKQ